MPEQVPPDVVAERYQRLVALVDDIAWDQKSWSSPPSRCSYAEGEGRKDDATRDVRPRARQPHRALRGV